MRKTCKWAIQILAASKEGKLTYKEITKRIQNLTGESVVRGKTPWETVNRDMNEEPDIFTFYRGGIKGLSKQVREQLGLPAEQTEQTEQTIEIKV